MFQNRKLGAALIIIGVRANNYVYLHDLFFGTYQEPAGAIVLGWVAAILIIATLAVTAVGLAIMMRSHAATPTE
jgi:hypothetical protein